MKILITLVFFLLALITYSGIVCHMIERDKDESN